MSCALDILFAISNSATNFHSTGVPVILTYFIVSLDVSSCVIYNYTRTIKVIFSDQFS